MGILPDAKLEAFAQHLLRRLAEGRPKPSLAAAKDAGYGGSSLYANAKKRAQRADVKARMIELAAPAQAQAEADLTLTIERAERRLGEIIFADIDFSNVKAPDVIAAVRQVAAIRGWNAPTTLNVNKHTHTDWSTDELVAFVLDAERRLAGDQAPGASETEPDRVH